MLMKIALQSLAWIALAVLSRGVAFGAMPSTADFQNALTACAAGSQTRFDADLLGSIVDMYEGQGTRGRAELDSLTSFLSLMPKEDRAAAYELYVNCISRILSPSASSPQAVPAPRTGPEPRASIRDFRMSGGATDFIGPDEILISMIGTPCLGRGNIVCIRVAGEPYHLGVGEVVNLVYSDGQCQLTLTEILKGQNAARFHVRCDPDGNASTSAKRDLASSRSFRMSGGTTESITPDEILVSMIGTPCAARGDIVCIRIAGERHSLSLGEQIALAYSGGHCTLALTEILEGQNSARFLLRC